MKQNLFLITAMALILVMFFVLGGSPGPRDISWQGQHWQYSGRAQNDLVYTFHSGDQFTVQRQGSGNFIIGLQGEEYSGSVQGTEISVRFPDGRQVHGIQYEGEMQTYVAPEDAPLFELLLAADTAVSPKTFKLVAGILVFIYSILNVRYPRHCVFVTMRFRRLINAGARPTSYHIKVSQVVGMVLLLASWCLILMGLWHI